MSMSKRTVFTTITPLPHGVSRELAIAELQDQAAMIDLNPLVINRFTTRPPSFASAEEFHCTWWQIEDRVSYLPGVKGKVTYHGAMNPLVNGLQTHVFAPLGLNIRTKWTINGTLPGEPAQPVEMGLNIPKTGLYLREDVDMKSTIGTTTFVKKTLVASHKKLVDRLVVKAQIDETRLSAHLSGSQYGDASSHRSSVLSSNAPASPHTPDGFPVASQQPSVVRLENGQYLDTTLVKLENGQLVDPRGSQISPYASPQYYNVDPAYQAANPYSKEPARLQPFPPQQQVEPVFEVHGSSRDPNRKYRVPNAPVELP